LAKQYTNSKAVNYGIDGPIFVFNTFVIGCFLFFGGLAIALQTNRSTFYAVLSAPAIVAGAICFWIGATILWGSLVGKLRLRDKLLADLNLRGDEKILGVGCGHGLLLVAAAKQLDKGGKAFGVDIWKRAAMPKSKRLPTAWKSRRATRAVCLSPTKLSTSSVQAGFCTIFSDRKNAKKLWRKSSEF
jgi:hypothetical protein